MSGGRDATTDLIGISLDKEKYYAGDTIKANLQLTLTKRMECCRIEATFHGVLYVRVEDPRKTGTFLPAEQLSQTKDFIKETKVVWRSENSDRLSAGLHEFSVHFDLPSEGILSSIEFPDRLAWVTYEISANTLLDDGVELASGSKEVEVEVRRDLRIEDPPVDEPVHVERTYEWDDGSFDIKVDLPKTGYAPGERFEMDFTVINNCTTIAKFALINILQTFTCYPDSPEKNVVQFTKETINDVIPMCRLRKGLSSIWTASFTVQDLHPSILIPDTINIQYEAQVSLFDGFEDGKPKRTGHVIKIPLIVGSDAVGKVTLITETAGIAEFVIGRRERVQMNLNE